MNILMVMAHPDDEAIFGWPIIQSIGDDKVSLLTLSNNSARYGGGPINALQEVCKTTGVNLLAYQRIDTNFYRLPTRYHNYLLSHAIDLFRRIIGRAIELTSPDYIFTHNPMGEYGHLDHRFVFDIVSMFNVPLMLTDICFANECHLSSDDMPKIYRDYFYIEKKEKKRCVLSMDWYKKMKRIYENYGAWSWSGHAPVTECKLYCFD